MLSNLAAEKVSSARTYRLFDHGKHAEQWSACQLIGSGRTALTPELLEEAWYTASLSYFAEQAGLVAAAELAAETNDAGLRFGLATAVSDEARHADAFMTYAILRGGDLAPCSEKIYGLHEELSGLSYLEKCLIHTLLEGFAADEFIILQRLFAGDPLAKLYNAVRRDELRHVAIGLDYLARAYSEPVNKEFWVSHARGCEARAIHLAGVNSMAVFFENLLGMPPQDTRDWFLKRNSARLLKARISISEGG